MHVAVRCNSVTTFDDTARERRYEFSVISGHPDNKGAVKTGTFSLTIIDPYVNFFPGDTYVIDIRAETKLTKGQLELTNA